MAGSSLDALPVSASGCCVSPFLLTCHAFNDTLKEKGIEELPLSQDLSGLVYSPTECLCSYLVLLAICGL